LIQTLIFDFDGLILDTELSALQSWQEIYQQHNCSLPLEKWATTIGGSTESFDACDYLETLVGRPLQRENLREKRRRRHMAMIATQSTLPGVEHYLAEARRLGLKIGLASSSSRAWVVDHLTRLGLHAHFDAMKCGDEVSHKKPYPELYLAVLEALRTSADQAIAFEDSPNGIRAAQRAGIFCVAIPNVITRQLSLDHADLHMTSMADMPLKELIMRVEKRQRKINTPL